MENFTRNPLLVQEHSKNPLLKKDSGLSSTLSTTSLLSRPSSLTKRPLSISEPKHLAHKKSLLDVSSSASLARPAQPNYLQLANPLSASTLTTKNNIFSGSSKGLYGTDLLFRDASLKTRDISTELICPASESKIRTEVEEEDDLKFPEYPDLQLDPEETDGRGFDFRTLSHEEREAAENLVAVKERLLEFVSVAAGGLAGELKQGGSTTRHHLDRCLDIVAKKDPEFVLKVGVAYLLLCFLVAQHLYLSS